MRSVGVAQTDRQTHNCMGICCLARGGGGVGGVVWANSFLFSMEPLVSVVLSLKCPEGGTFVQQPAGFPASWPAPASSAQGQPGASLGRAAVGGGPSGAERTTEQGLSDVLGPPPSPARPAGTLVPRPLRLREGSPCSPGFLPAPSVPGLWASVRPHWSVTVRPRLPGTLLVPAAASGPAQPLNCPPAALAHAQTRAARSRRC